MFAESILYFTPENQQ